METFLKIYGLTQSLFIIYWLYVMVKTKPTFNNGRNRIAKNWNEGGKMLLFGGTVLFFVVSLLITFGILALSVMEKHI